MYREGGKREQNLPCADKIALSVNTCMLHFITVKGDSIIVVLYSRKLFLTSVRGVKI